MNWRKRKDILPEDGQEVVYDVGLKYDNEPKGHYEGRYTKAHREFSSGYNHDFFAYDERAITYWIPIEEFKRGEQSE